MDEYNILVVGVGGQGILFLSEILGEAALKAGLNVRVAEVHGMAQRGGSVICTVRLGSKVFSPIIAEKQAHLIIALEPIEALRYIKYANTDTLIVLNRNSIEPPGLYISNQKYPKLNTIIKSLKMVSPHILEIDALKLAIQAGNPATQNSVLLGVISATGQFPLTSENIKETMVHFAKKDFKDVNVKAFNLGFQSIDTSKT